MLECIQSYIAERRSLAALVIVVWWSVHRILHTWAMLECIQSYTAERPQVEITSSSSGCGLVICAQNPSYMDNAGEHTGQSYIAEWRSLAA